MMTPDIRLSFDMIHQATIAHGLLTLESIKLMPKSTEIFNLWLKP